MSVSGSFFKAFHAAPRSGALRSWLTGEAGSVAPLAALLLVPILGAAGVAIDYGRTIATKTTLQLAADSAVLAARHGGLKEPDAIKARVEAFFNQNVANLGAGLVTEVKVSLPGNAVEIEVKAEVPATLAAVLGKDRFKIKVRSKAVAAAEDVEIALVLDNTGSMRDYMDDLKQGARDLVEAIYAGATHTSKIKMAVVPYVGAVNIGTGGGQMAWMDTTADSAWHASFLEHWGFGYEAGCTWTPGPGGGGGPGSGTTGSVFDLLPRFASAVQSVFGIASAHAASAADVPSPFQFLPPCWIGNPPKINLFDLYANIPNTAWKGCVMARTEPYDVDDTPPSIGDANTLFVPWFWPDQPDAASLVTQGLPFLSPNDYLPDRLDLTPAKFRDYWYGFGHWTILKYNNANAVIDESGPDTLGPNKACPDPILPLSNTKSDVLAAIDQMTHWNGSGTNTAEGLAWGWRVLSPEPPFTEGAPYGKIRKILVLMTDGVNNIDVSPDPETYSDFSAYGYLRSGRLPVQTFDAARDHMDQRMELVCQNAKAKGVIIYTVAFGVSDATTLAKLEACATKPPYFYEAGTANELIGAFNSIGQSLTELRLAE